MSKAAIKMKKITVALLTLALLAFLPAGQASAAAKHYKDAKHGFSFSYPETWQEFDFLAGGTIVHAPPEDGASANFTVNASAPLELAAMTEELLVEIYEIIVSDIEILSYKVTKLNGQPCIFADMLCSSKGKQQQRMRQQVYMANHRGKGYTLVLTSAVRSFGKSEDSFKMILDSFKF